MPPSTPPELRWGIAGTGTISWSVAPDLVASGAEITAVYSRRIANAKRLAEVHAIPHAEDDFGAFIERADIDVIYLATPFALHHKMAASALRAGKHVLVEKPMAMTRQQVVELFDIAKDNDRFLMEAMWTKFNPAFIGLTKAINDGAIGEVRSIRAGFGFPFPDDGGSKWDPRRSGGALLDQGIYPITLAYSLLGVPESVLSEGVVRDDGLDLSHHTTLEFSGNRFAHCASSIIEFVNPSATVNGTAGWIHIPAPFWALSSFSVHAGDAHTMFVDPLVHHFPTNGNGYTPMLTAVGTAIRRGLRQHPTHDHEATIGVFSVLDRISSALKAVGSV
ncbi:Gfo/Idh/MocA family protein [Microbacterium sp. ZW T5_56]|uniref:Gfo/Idh/MocA family protein n=1 Tax=Microbacterium sp. ZW T5_56 TaxID=3378081 RepID=UPI003853312A